MCSVTSIEENLEKNSIISSVKKYIPFATAYSFFFCGVYLYVYWGEFHINIFEYANPVDIFMLAVPGLARGIFLLLFIVWAGMQVYDEGKNTEKPTGKSKKLYLFGVIWRVVFFAFMIFLVASAIGGFFRWMFFALIFGGSIAISLNKNTFFAEIKNSAFRSTLIFFIISMPFISCEAGVIYSNLVISGSSYQYTEYTHQAENNATKVEQKLRYIGTIGESVFFYEPEGASTIITTINHIGTLQLYKYEDAPRIFLNGLMVSYRTKESTHLLLPRNGNIL